MNNPSRDCRRRSRIKILTEMGGKCVKCGWTDFRAMHIDHVKGNGNEHRKKAKTEEQRYRDVRLYPNDFQILCANCNEIKRWEMGQATGPKGYVKNS